MFRFTHCNLKNWIPKASDKCIFEVPEALRARLGSGRKTTNNNQLMPYEFKKINHERLERDDSICRWKDVYVRFYHLQQNWSEGRYVVKPVLRGHTQPITCLDCNGKILF